MVKAESFSWVSWLPKYFGYITHLDFRTTIYYLFLQYFLTLRLDWVLSRNILLLVTLIEKLALNMLLPYSSHHSSHTQDRVLLCTLSWLKLRLPSCLGIGCISPHPVSIMIVYKFTDGTNQARESLGTLQGQFQQLKAFWGKLEKVCSKMISCKRILANNIRVPATNVPMGPV